MSTRTAGVLAATAQLAAGELAAAALPGGRSPVSGLGRALIDLTPGPGVDMAVATVEHHDKTVLKAQLAGGLLALGAARRPVLPALAGVAAMVGAATRRESATGASLAAGGAGIAAGALAARAAERRPGAVAGLALAAGAAALGLRAREREGFEARRAAVAFPAAVAPAGPVPPGASFDVEGLTPLYSRPGDFYVTDVQLPAPQVDLASWRLRVHGLVERPLELTYDALLALGLVELDSTLVCVHNPVGGPRIGSARWLGVPLAAVLERAGVRPGAEQVVARSVDGFSAGLPLEHVRSGAPALLAVGMGGEPLPAAHGFPVRLLVPGLWGADANTKWVAELELATWAAVRDYWDARGWPRRPTRVRPGSRIDLPANRAVVAPGPVTVAGVAWAPPAGVERVEVRVDGGGWRPATLSAEVAPTLWRQWRADVELGGGEHRLEVRAIGRAGRQREEPAPPYPTGSSGYHAIRVSAAPGAARPRVRRGAAARDDLAGRLALAAAAVPAWRARGYPPAPRFPAPAA